jgi:hypothetical protein
MKDIFLWVILPLALAEAILLGPWLSERLLRWGALGLPEEYRERYVEDWLGELDAVPGSLTKLGFAIRVLIRVPATERALTGRDALWVLAARRLLALLITGVTYGLIFLVRVSMSIPPKPNYQRLVDAGVISVKRYGLKVVRIGQIGQTAPLRRDSPLEHTSLDAKTLQVLRRGGINTFWDLLGRYGAADGQPTLRDIDGFGSREMEAVHRVLTHDAVDHSEGGLFGGA